MSRSLFSSSPVVTAGRRGRSSLFLCAGFAIVASGCTRTVLDLDAPVPDAGVADSGCVGAGPGEASDGFILFDSDRIDFVRHIFAVRADGCGVTQLTFGPSDEQEPALSPDGKTLVYTSNEAGASQLYALDLATKSVRTLTAQAGGAGHAAYSPDGTKIAYDASGVYVMNADGSGTYPLITSASGAPQSSMYAHPVFISDGTGIVADCSNGLDVFDLTGHYQRTLVTHYSTDVQSPAISRDGNEVAFTAGCPDVANAVAVASLGGMGLPCDRVVYRETAPSGSLGHPTWGPRGLIAFSRPSSADPSTLVVIDDANDVHELLPDAGTQTNALWAPATFSPE